MGTTCAKGSSTTDPDKTPYGPGKGKPSQARKGKTWAEEKKPAAGAGRWRASDRQENGEEEREKFVPRREENFQPVKQDVPRAFEKEPDILFIDSSSEAVYLPGNSPGPTGRKRYEQPAVTPPVNKRTHSYGDVPLEAYRTWDELKQQNQVIKAIEPSRELGYESNPTAHMNGELEQKYSALGQQSGYEGNLNVGEMNEAEAKPWTSNELVHASPVAIGYSNVQPADGQIDLNSAQTSGLDYSRLASSTKPQVNGGSRDVQPVAVQRQTSSRITSPLKLDAVNLFESRSPIEKVKPAVDMNVESNMAIFNALKKIRTPSTANGTSSKDLSDSNPESGSPRISAKLPSNVILPPLKTSDSFSKKGSAQTSAERPRYEPSGPDVSKLHADLKLGQAQAARNASTRASNGVIPQSSTEPLISTKLPIHGGMTVATAAHVSNLISEKSNTMPLATSENHSSFPFETKNPQSSAASYDTATSPVPTISSLPTISPKIPLQRLPSASSEASSPTAIVRAYVASTSNAEPASPSLQVSQTAGQLENPPPASALADGSQRTRELMRTRQGSQTVVAQEEDGRGDVTSLQRDSGISSPEAVEKTDPKHVSKLPTSRLTSSSTSPTSSTFTSPGTSTVNSPAFALASPLPTSPLIYPTSPSQITRAPSLPCWVTPLEDELPQHEQATLLQPILLDLTEQNRAVTDFNLVCPNTRMKLLQAVERWFNGKDRENPTRVMAIQGKSGIGKTCVFSEVCRSFSKQLAGCHFFQNKPLHPEQNSAISMLMTLACKLGSVFPNYVEAVSRPDALKAIINGGDVLEVFDALVSQPLQSQKIGHDPDHRMLIVLDDINECDYSHRDQVIQLINDFNQTSPEWLYLLVSLNDDPQILSQLSNVQLIEIKGTSEAMTTDLKRYFRDPMTPFIDRITLDGAQTQLMQNSQGSFLCAYFLRKRLQSFPLGTKLALRDVALFPAGLGGVYNEAFQRLFDYLKNKYPTKDVSGVYGAFVGLLVVAQEPIDKAAFLHILSGLDVNEALAQLGACLLMRNNTFVSFYHRNTSDWLQSSELAPPNLMPNIEEARQRMADLCMKWLSVIVGMPERSSVERNLQAYALQHALTHVTDVPKQYENIARILCSPGYIEEKLKLSTINLKSLLADFKHSHYQQNSSDVKLITLEGYMKKYPNLMEQIQAVCGFVVRNGKGLETWPKFTLQMAANYPTNPRIQQNARLDVQDQPWLEDLTAITETPFVAKSFDGTICDVDGSSDNKTLFVITKNKESTAFFHVLNAVNGDRISDPINLKCIGDRSGNCVKVLADNTSVFVASLTSYINLKTGKPVPSGLDLNSIPFKDRFSIECCDSVGNLLCCGVSTLPWGGRSLHVLVFDFRTSKCTKTLEVLKFKFGGSAQFGIKACSFSMDGTLLCACVKQTNKSDLKVTTWSTATWEIVQSTDVDNDAPTKCSFIGNQDIFIGASVRTKELVQGRPQRMKTYLWTIDEKFSEVGLMNAAERSSVTCARGSQLATAQWFQLRGQVTVRRWRRWAAGQPPDDRLTLYGIDEASEIMAFDKIVVFITPKSLRFYKFSEMEKIQTVPNDESFSLPDAQVLGVSFMPRSDEPIVTYSIVRGPERDLISSCTLNLKSDGISVNKRLFTNVKPAKQANNESVFSRKCFLGADSSSEICRASPDGGQAIFRNGNDITVLELVSGTKVSLPMPEAFQKLGETDSLVSVVSPKDFLIAVVYSTAPARIYLHDIKAKQGARPIEIHVLENSQPSAVNDISFLPSTGNVIACSERSLFVWNQKTGALVSIDTNVDVAYVRSSPTSDRLTVSRQNEFTRPLVLRNSDNNINSALRLAPESQWLPDFGKSDVEFSADGTVLVGVCYEGHVCRVWNAANGEVLRDLALAMNGDVEIVGMLTNTHALLSDEMGLVACDIGTGDVIIAHPIDGALAKKSDMASLRISPRGNFVVGAAKDGALRIYQSHNIAAVRRKTTLARMKSK